MAVQYLCTFMLLSTRRGFVVLGGFRVFSKALQVCVEIEITVITTES